MEFDGGSLGAEVRGGSLWVGVWGWESGSGILGAGVWRWEFGGGSLGVVVWGWESGSGSLGVRVWRWEFGVGVWGRESRVEIRGSLEAGVWGGDLGVQFGDGDLGAGVLGHYNIFLGFGFILNDFFLKSLIFLSFNELGTN